MAERGTALTSVDGISWRIACTREPVIRALLARHFLTDAQRWSPSLVGRIGKARRDQRRLDATERLTNGIVLLESVFAPSQPA